MTTGGPERQKIKCKGKSVKRHDRNHHDKAIRGQPILDEDGRRQYQPCGNWASIGSDVCASHGGNAPQVIAAAKKQLALATHNIAIALENIALDERIAPEVRIRAAAQVMDRAGIRAGVDLSIETPKWQKMLAEEFGSEDSPEDPPAPTPPEEETKPKTRRSKAAPPSGRPKFEGW